MAHEHFTGFPGAIDRTPAHPEWDGLVFGPNLAQSGEMNEVQSIISDRARRTGDLVASDGDRIEGATIFVDTAAGTVSLAAGKIYIRGDIRPVAQRTLSDVVFAGDVVIGVRLTTALVTADDAPILLGLVPGTESEGEDGAARIVQTIAWALETEELPGDFYGVYLVQNGTVIDQTPPPSLSGINLAIAAYDRGAHGSYIVDGCRVTALGLAGTKQAFSIQEGEANINGFKRTRFTALRHEELQAWEVETVDAEPHIFEDSGEGATTITLNHGPLNTINTITITKEVTETVIRGFPNNTADVLTHTGVTEILEIVQSSTTFVPTTDFVLSADAVSWAAGGDEPAGGSSYDVTYRYLVNVLSDSVDLAQDRVTVSGGVDGEPMFISYGWKLPRVDLLCLDQNGLSLYLRGQASRDRPQPPLAPSQILPLATITNDWRATPVVRNVGVRSMHYTLLNKLYERFIDALDLIALERLKRDIDSREPTAKRGIFVDPFTDDFYRDQGEPQTAAVFLGAMQLAVDPTFFPVGNDTIMLDYTEEVVISQRKVTGCEPINPFQNFDPLPGQLTLTPSQDYWTVTRTEWLSQQTKEVRGRTQWTATNAGGVGTRTELLSIEDELVDHRQELLEFLRPIPVAFEIQGFQPDEPLNLLTFDGVNVTPPDPLQANAGGVITGSFTIPENITAGSKEVVAHGEGDRAASAEFVGQGIVETDVMQRIVTNQVTTIRRERDNGGDPMAETWSLESNRHIVGFNAPICHIGDATKPVVFDMVNVSTGLPNGDVVSSVLVPLAGIEEGDWLNPRFVAPVFRSNDREYAMVIKTDDAEHSMSVATIGQRDEETGAIMSGQPYTVGVRLGSSNNKTWTPIQESDLTFEVVAALFSPTTKTVVLGSFDLIDCSDLLIRASVDLPTGECTFMFEVERTSGEVIKLQANEPHQFNEYVTETVELRAVLTGTSHVSPTLWPGVMLVSGKLRAEGTYVSRAFGIGAAARLNAYIKTLLPLGSTITAHVDHADDTWVDLGAPEVAALNDGWTEREWEMDPITAVEGRVKITLTGTPAARPFCADFRVPIF